MAVARDGLRRRFDWDDDGRHAAAVCDEVRRRVFFERPRASLESPSARRLCLRHPVTWLSR
jgi:hypothetical protein